MNMSKLKLASVAAALVTVMAAPAQAQVRITEVAPWSSGNSPVAADWFEVTNFGTSAVSLSGWRVDDNSNAFGSALTLRGIGSIAAGESVIFLESNASGSNDASINAAFLSTWFGSAVPTGVSVGNYGGSGIGLSTSGDAVNLFNGAGLVQTRVTFGASPSVPPFATFDNSAGLDNVALAQVSAVGLNGAFVAAGSPGEIGSPFAVSAVPEAGAAVQVLAGMLALGFVAVRRRQR